MMPFRGVAVFTSAVYRLYVRLVVARGSWHSRLTRARHLVHGISDVALSIVLRRLIRSLGFDGDIRSTV